MIDALNLLNDPNAKNQKFVIDKIFHPLDVHFDTNFGSVMIRALAPLDEVNYDGRYLVNP